jgi:hypothetical protein
MNSKNISKVLRKKIDTWKDSIGDPMVRDAVGKDTIVTGGALVSLLSNEEVNDYDIYFRTKETCKLVALYYANIWNTTHKDKFVEVKEEDGEDGRITCFIKSAGVVSDGSIVDDASEPGEEKVEEKVEKPIFRPRYISSNAISLSDKIQIVLRFYGEVEELHKNYDYIHCTCSYDHNSGEVTLPTRALECIINKELYYIGSKYPLCSIIRSRKFIKRGWSINAGQYLKMCLQLNEFDLKNITVLQEQITGVDSAYFDRALREIHEKQELDPDFKIDNSYLFEIINRIF